MTSPKRVNSWVVTDDFWQRVEPLIRARHAQTNGMVERFNGRIGDPVKQPDLFQL